MKYLNLGCGMHYSTDAKWTNVDFESDKDAVIGHNLLKGVPFPDETFDFVYHSHVLEHFSKNDGKVFIKECMRVLKPGGVIRVVIPDLERIVKEYIKWLELGLQNQDDEKIASNYNWIMLEMYDQTVRNVSGGDMKGYIFQENIPNEDYMYERIGEEGRGLRQSYLNSIKDSEIRRSTFRELASKAKTHVRKYLSNLMKRDSPEQEIGRFRLGGQIHQWMYDRYSLSQMLRIEGANNIVIRDTFSSYLQDWEQYSLDGKRPIIRKPDSLYLEAIKG